MENKGLNELKKLIDKSLDDSNGHSGGSNNVMEIFENYLKSLSPQPSLSEETEKMPPITSDALTAEFNQKNFIKSSPKSEGIKWAVSDEEIDLEGNTNPTLDRSSERIAFKKGAIWMRSQSQRVKPISEEWISVEERKEIKGGRYLVIDQNDNNTIRTAFYRNYNGLWVLYGGDQIHPSHYKPLPEPPKFKSQENNKSK